MKRAPTLLLGLSTALALTACSKGEAPAGTSAGPRLYITSPRMDQTLPGPDVEVMLDLRDYPIGRADEGGNGQHVHVIVDNEPYQAIYDVTKPVKLDAKLMTEGTHVIRAFPSAGPKDGKGALHHESRKNPGAFAWVRFHVKAKGGALADFDGGAPLLTFSRPKGAYKVGSPELQSFLVDYYLTNVTLAPGSYAVQMTLDGKALGPWTTWERHVLDAPPALGEHTIVLELLDGGGKPVPGPINRTERIFTVVP